VACRDEERNPRGIDEFLPGRLAGFGFGAGLAFVKLVVSPVRATTEDNWPASV